MASGKRVSNRKPNPMGYPSRGWREPSLTVGRKYLVVDLHGYDWLTGAAVGAEAVKQAWRRGFERVELIHGRSTSRGFGRSGTIKWGLRGLLSRGVLIDYAYYRRSTKHRLQDGSMELALKPNPEPITDLFPQLDELARSVTDWEDFIRLR